MLLRSGCSRCANCPDSEHRVVYPKAASMLCSESMETRRESSRVWRSSNPACTAHTAHGTRPTITDNGSGDQPTTRQTLERKEGKIAGETRTQSCRHSAMPMPYLEQLVHVGKGVALGRSWVEAALKNGLVAASDGTPQSAHGTGHRREERNSHHAARRMAGGVARKTPTPRHARVASKRGRKTEETAHRSQRTSKTWS